MARQKKFRPHAEKFSPMSEKIYKSGVEVYEALKYHYGPEETKKFIDFLMYVQYTTQKKMYHVRDNTMEKLLSELLLRHILD